MLGRALTWASLAASALAGCGDPMLPSDYSGPPAGEVRGNVVSADGQREAERPLLSLEWLSTLDPAAGRSALVGQLVSYQPSPRLQVGWNIDLGAPGERSKVDLDVAERRVRVGFARMVYFDDRVPDRRLDWGCAGPACDRVRAVSAQYVLYVEDPPYCQTDGRPAQPRMRPGYHYYSFDGQSVRPLAAGEAMSFSITDRSPAEADPSADLRAFAAALRTLWWAGALEGC